MTTGPGSHVTTVILGDPGSKTSQIEVPHSLDRRSIHTHDDVPNGMKSRRYIIPFNLLVVQLRVIVAFSLVD